MRARLTGLAAALVLVMAGPGVAGAVTTPAAAGAGWTAQHVPMPAGGQNANAIAVSCPSAGDCVLVGGYGTASASPPLAEGWTGHAWTPQTVPVPAGALNTGLTAVSCVSATQCMAVGGYVHGTGFGTQSFLSEQRAGGTWTAQTAIPLPAGGTGGSLTGISCVSASSCTAVGGYGTAGGLRAPVAEHWNGHAWALERIPVPGNATRRSDLSAVACTSADSCLAVGSYALKAHPDVYKLLIEHGNGHAWTLMSAPLPAAAIKGGALDAISCPSVADCTAAGLYWPANTLDSYNLAEHWNGSTWVVQSTPSPGTTHELADVLTGISCASASSCTAVGTSVARGAVERPVGEYWNGSAWAVQQTAKPKQAVGPEGVSCASATTCTAVGNLATKGDATVLPFAEHK
ncbi:MAG TPA: hypothetical protein VGH27_18590 [Streptosporangiaceae bacterium]|jgi:hypothetical protein